MKGLTDSQVWVRVLEQMVKAGVMTNAQYRTIVDEQQALAVLGSVDTRGLSVETVGWRDNVQSFTSAKVGATKNPTFATFVGTIGAYSFSDTIEQELTVSFHIDHDYKAGSAVFPHIHWSPADATAGVVRWGVEYTFARGHDQEAFGATQTIYLEQTAPGVALQHMIAEVPDPGITLANLEPDTIVICRVFRDSTHINDTYAAGAFGHMADLHYQTDHYATVSKVPDFTVA